MAKSIYNNETLKIMSLFSKITRTDIKDTFVDNNGLLTFIVQQGQLARAVGKNALNVKRMENLLKRKIKIVEFNPDMVKFIKNLIYPLKTEEIIQEGNIVTIKGPDMKTKGMLIGRNAKNLRNTENIVKKYFDVEELKVV